MIRNAAPPAWDVVYALPNLYLPARHPRYDDPPDPDSPDLHRAGLTLGAPDVAIVPAADGRVRAAAAGSAGVRALVEGFRDDGGRPVAPALLIVRRRARVVERSDALIAFRNALALAVILRARTEAVTGGAAGRVVWSDLFDFFPATVTRTGRLVVRSPALHSLFSETVKLHATPAPHVYARERRLVADTFLWRALGAEWRRRYRGLREDDPFGRSLFRSLELAYAAAAVPMRNAGSLFDYGAHLALWVSALEVLAWPRARHADLDAVRALLREMPWPHDARWVRSRRYVVRDRRGRKARGTPAERVVALLYDARNAFLHGNPVSTRTLLPWGPAPARRGATLPHAAAIVYRIALTAYLAARHPHGLGIDHPHAVMDYVDAGASARALSALLRPGRDDADLEPDAWDGAGETPDDGHAEDVKAEAGAEHPG